MTKIITGWNSQQGEGKYSIQFETNNKTIFKMVESICQRAIDITERENKLNELCESIVGSYR